MSILIKFELCFIKLRLVNTMCFSDIFDTRNVQEELKILNLTAFLTFLFFFVEAMKCQLKPISELYLNGC